MIKVLALADISNNDPGVPTKLLDAGDILDKRKILGVVPKNNLPTAPNVASLLTVISVFNSTPLAVLLVTLRL